MQPPQSWEKSTTMRIAVKNAGRGIVDAARREWKLKIAAACTVAALLVGWLLNLSGVALGLIILLSASIIAAEMLNSALETILDSMFPNYHEGVRKTKDLAAGAVLVLSLAAAVIALMLFLPPLINVFF